jgi:hypothetical protein
LPLFIDFAYIAISLRFHYSQLFITPHLAFTPFRCRYAPDITIIEDTDIYFAADRCAITPLLLFAIRFQLTLMPPDMTPFSLTL